MRGSWCLPDGPVNTAGWQLPPLPPPPQGQRSHLAEYELLCLAKKIHLPLKIGKHVKKS